QDCGGDASAHFHVNGKCGSRRACADGADRDDRRGTEEQKGWRAEAAAAMAMASVAATVRRAVICCCISPLSARSGGLGNPSFGQLAFASEDLSPGLSVATRTTRLFLSLSHLDCLPPLEARSW